MRLSEILIIYMAIAAPHGVTSFLQQSSSESLMKRLTETSGATFLWPLAWIQRISKICKKDLFTASAQDRLDDAVFVKIEAAARKLLAALDDVCAPLRLNDDE